MNRASFDRVIRACCRHLGCEEVVVVGSQAFFATLAELPGPGAVSMEVDLVLDSPELRDEVAGLFGELSQFHETWGVYADPVEVTTSRLPQGWDERLLDVVVEDRSRGRSYTARCADPHDLCVAKLVAGRDKDRDLLRALFSAGNLDPAVVTERLGLTTLTPGEAVDVADRLARWSS